MTCCICMSNKCNINTICNHSFCHSCIKQLNTDDYNVQYCPICREVLKYDYKGITTQKTQNDILLQNTQNFVCNMRKLIECLQTITDRKERITYIENMIKFIFKHDWIKKHKQFDVIVNKIKERLNFFVNTDNENIFNNYLISW